MPPFPSQRALHAFVSGRVQGVAFRWAARARARELGLNGWVRNLEDGRVETWVEGDATAVDAMRAWLHEGPSAARVSGVITHPAEPEGLSGFEVRRDQPGLR